MRNRKRQIRYIPGLRSYIRKEHKTNNYKRRYGYDFQNNYNKLSILLIVIGAILIAIGTIGIFQNTIVYSPLKFFGSSKGGVSFVTSTILLFIGMVAIVLKSKTYIGRNFNVVRNNKYSTFNILFFKNEFITNFLLKAILIFGSILLELH